MKICIITFEFPPSIGGIASASNRIARYFKDIGNEVHIFTVSGRDNYFVNGKKEVKTEEREGLTVHTMTPYAGSLTQCPPQEVQNIVYFLEEIHKKYDFDIFHGFRLNPCGYVASILAKKFNKRSIASSRGNDIDRDIYDPMMFPRIKWTLDNVDNLTFVSKKQLSLADFFIPCKEKSKVILNSINPGQFFVKKPADLNLKGFVVGFVGTVRRKKGFVYLLEAFAEFSKKHEATLLIIGDFIDSEKPEYIKMVQGSGVQDKIVITGWIPHKYTLNYLDLIDVFILPSIAEGCPNALLEAMYCKKPCIVTDAGAMDDIIEDGSNGIIIPKYSSEGILSALNKLYQNPDLRVKLGDKSYESIQERFKPTREIEEWAGVLR